MGDETRIFMGTPSKEELMRYFAREQSKQRIKQLQQPIYDRDSSPELSDSFKIELDQRKKKVEEEKMRLARELDSKNEKENKMPEVMTTRASMSKKKMSMHQPNESLDDEAFLEMEKMCERTLNLNNVTAPFVDLTAIDDYEVDDSFLNDLKTKKSIGFSDETCLLEVEAPSLLFNNTSSLMSPNTNSPMKSRPSTIMEVTETSFTNRTAASSYVTAKSSDSAEKSEYYQTANESMEETANETMEEETKSLTSIKKPSLKPFFDDESFNFTKDSLDTTEKIQKVDEMTLDSLNSQSKADSSSGVDSSYDQEVEEAADELINSCLDQEEAEADESADFDNTLDRFDFMLAQAQKMEVNQPKTPVVRITTPKNSPAPNKPSPSPWSVTKQSAKLKGTPLSAVKNSPLIKFSPAAPKSPAVNNFKLPSKPASTSKIPQISSNSKKFQHIVSPISRYIHHTPELPLGSNAHIQYGGAGSSRRFNFRDSESFCNTTLNQTVQASSLPIRAKTTTTAKQVIDNRHTPKIPGGKKIQGLLGNSSPTVTIHKSHKATGSHDIFKDNTFNDDTLLGDVDLSLVAGGDVSYQVVEDVKRLK